MNLQLKQQTVWNSLKLLPKCPPSQSRKNLPAVFSATIPKPLFEWLRGWKQKWPRMVPTIPEEQQTRTKQPRTEKLTLLPNFNCVPTITHVTSHLIEQKTSMLGKWLCSLKKDIVVPLYPGCIKSFIEN